MTGNCHSSEESPGSSVSLFKIHDVIPLEFQDLQEKLKFLEPNLAGMRPRCLSGSPPLIAAPHELRFWRPAPKVVL